MSVVADEVLEFDEQRELADAPDELRLTESAGVVAPSLRAEVLARAEANGITLREGEELLQVIRPGIGGGRGTRYYAPAMLRENAHVFTGARMFRNHLTDKQRKELEGLPRPIEHLAGRIREAWWDGEVPADDKFEQGGVYAAIRPTKFIREALDDDPELFDSSISALATTIRPGNMNGRRVAIVEGIRSKPISVDWVTEGGAGGRALREAADQEEAVLESMSDEEVRAYLYAERPEILEAIKSQKDPDGDGDDDTAEMDQRVAAHMKKGKSRKEAVALATAEIKAAKETTEGAEQMPVTAEELREALASDEGKAVLLSLVEEMAPSMDGYVKADEVETLVESQMAERADLIRIEARGDLERQIEVRDLRDAAVKLVESAKVHPKLGSRIIEEFSLDASGAPSAALAAITSDFDDDGTLVKSASEKLVEAVTERIEDAKEIMGAVRPTRVRGAGRGEKLVESKKADGDKDDTDDTAAARKPKSKSTSGSALADELLEGAGFSHESLGNLWANGL